MPNDAVMEEGSRRFVYVRDGAGAYDRREIQTGVQGDSHTQVESGLSPGEEVVTLGAFFIDAEDRMSDDSTRTATSRL